MKYKLFFSITLTLTLLFCSCSLNNQADIVLDYFKSSKHTSTICEDNENIFFAKANGIYKKTKSNGQQNLLYKIASPQYLYQFNDRLFFVSSEGKKLYETKKDGSEFSEVIDIEKLPSKYKNVIIDDYFVSGNKIYVSSPSSSFSFDLQSKGVNPINDNIGTSAMEISNNDLYYIGHSDRSFSIYKCGLDGKNSKLFLGSGISEPSSELYADFVICGEKFYCEKRLENGLYIFDGNSEQKLFEGDILNLTEKNGTVYFISQSNQKSTLYSVNGTDCRNLAELNDYDKAGGFSVVDRRIYYITKDSEIGTIRMN